MKIAIDPGHLGGEWARMEERWYVIGDSKPVADPMWSAIFAEPAAKLHLYGKAEPRPGRKMGHFNVRGRDVEMALTKARELKTKLSG